MCPLVVTVGQFHLNSAVYYRALFCRLLQTLNNLILLILRHLLKLVKRKVKMFYGLLLTSLLGNSIRLLVILQSLKGIKLLHTTVTSLNKDGEGVCNGFYYLLLGKNLALNGINRQKGEGDYS